MASLQRTETALPAEFRCSSWSFFSLLSEESTRYARWPLFLDKTITFNLKGLFVFGIFFSPQIFGVEMFASDVFRLSKVITELASGERWMPELMFPLGGAKVGTLSYRQLPHLEMPVLNEPG